MAKNKKRKVVKTGRRKAYVSGSPYQELVASVVRAFDPGASVETGKWIQGPDGRRDMDVSVVGTIDSRPYTGVIECKDYDVRSTGKVGIELVDALDSKRHDLDVNFALICSNSGFTADALNKARRKGIGAVTILARSDTRVKVVIEKLVYFRRITLSPVAIAFDFGDGGKNYPDLGSSEVTYNGLAVDLWLMHQASLYATTHPTHGDRLTASFRLKNPTWFDLRGKKIMVKCLTVTFTPQHNWFSHVARLDADRAMYDYLREKVRLAPGPNSYVVGGLDFTKGTPVEFDPAFLDTDISPGEMAMQFTLIEDVCRAGQEHPKLDDLIEPNDLKDIFG